MSSEPPESPMEKRLIAHGLAHGVIFSLLLDLLIKKNLISVEESRELFQEAALFFMKTDATDIERMAGDAILSSMTNR
jgi:hypothetical protein